MSKKALLVGINKYLLPGNDLRGCINDVYAIEAELKSYKYTEIHRLRDEDATRENILSELEWLITNSEELVFHYSGHGTQFDDPNDNSNESIQALCPHNLYDINTVITDKQLHQVFHKIPTSSSLYFIADCCHSGTIDRDIILGPHTLPRTIIPRFMTIPGMHKPKKKPRSMVISSTNRHMLLSGCKDDQTSADAYFGNIPHGALTYAFINHLRNNRKLNWTQIHTEILPWMTSHGFNQTPQLSGPPALLNRIIFE